MSKKETHNYLVRFPLEVWEELEEKSNVSGQPIGTIIIDRVVALGTSKVTPDSLLRSARSSYANAVYNTNDTTLSMFATSNSDYNSVIQTLSGSSEDQDEQEGLTS